MKCDELQELVVAYAAGELVPAQREFVAMHLAQCNRCQSALAGLNATRRQLESLRYDAYHPQLTGRIAGALERQRRRGVVRRWAGRGARMALGGAATAVAAAVLAAVLQGRPALDAFRPAPAAPPPGTAAYVLTDAHLLQVDLGRASATSVASVLPKSGAQVTGAAGGRFLLTGGELYAFGPSLAQPRLIARVSGRLLGASPDGRTVWVLRSVDDAWFAVDAVDVSTGEVQADRQAKPGNASGGVVSRDGRQIYVVAEVNGTTYLKAIDAESRVREDAFPLGDMGVASTPLGAPGLGLVYVAGYSRLAVVAPVQGSDAVSLYSVPGLTPTAALSPDGKTLASAREGGGITLVAPASGTVLAQSKGPQYAHLVWSETGEWLYAASGNRLDILASDRLITARRIALPAGETPVDLLGR